MRPMGTVQSRSNIIRVRDLGLAAYLASLGVKSKLAHDGQSPKGHPLAAWEYEPTDLVRSQIERFGSGQASVEPKTFQIALTATRRELYAFLGIG